MNGLEELQYQERGWGPGPQVQLRLTFLPNALRETHGKELVMHVVRK